MSVVLPLNRDEYEKWVASRPEIIQKMAASHPPDRLYNINTGHAVTIYSYAEDETVTVLITREFNPLIFMERSVFGIPIEELVECEINGSKYR